MVQQNEQSRIQQNKVKEQNQQLIHEVQEMKQLIEEMREEQDRKHESERALLRKTFLATQKTMEQVASSVEANKGRWKRLWNRLFGKIA